MRVESEKESREWELRFKKGISGPGKISDRRSGGEGLCGETKKKRDREYRLNSSGPGWAGLCRDGAWQEQQGEWKLLGREVGRELEGVDAEREDGEGKGSLCALRFSLRGDRED